MGKRRRGRGGSGSGGRNVDVAGAGAGAGWMRRVKGVLLLGRVVSTVVTAVIDRLLKLELLQTPSCIRYRAYAPNETDLLSMGFVGSRI